MTIAIPKEGEALLDRACLWVQGRAVLPNKPLVVWTTAYAWVLRHKHLEPRVHVGMWDDVADWARGSMRCFGKSRQRAMKTWVRALAEAESVGKPSISASGSGTPVMCEIERVFSFDGGGASLIGDVTWRGLRDALAELPDGYLQRADQEWADRKDAAR